MSNDLGYSPSPSLPFRLTAANLEALLMPFLGVMLLVRVLTDDRSAANSRHSGSLNLSAAIAALFIVMSVGALLYRRRGVLPAVLAAVWLCVWIAIAAHNRGASAETLREGVREGSVIALAVILYNARALVSPAAASRLVQVLGFAPAILALYQLATHTGLDVAGNIRSNGTFAHPNAAAMFFAIAATASLWRYLDNGRRRSDASLVALFAAALIATFSIDGLVTVCAMLIAFGLLRPGSVRARLVPCLLAGLVLIVFFATPLGSRRLASESSTSIATAERNEANSTLAWRLHKWKTLLPEWESSPLVGQGLGTTTTAPGVAGNEYAGALPHNEYLRYLVETGVLGVLPLLAALAVLARALLRRRRIPGTPQAGTLGAATLATVVVIGCMVNSLADNTLLNSPTCYVAVLIVVAVLSSVDVARPPRPVAVG